MDNVVNFKNSSKYKSAPLKGIEQFAKIIQEKIDDKQNPNIFAVLYNKEDDTYEVFEVGDYRLNELLGDIELLKDFIKSGH
jgi:hypothetical protein